MIGMDGDCVVNVRIDTKRADPAKTLFANLLASKLEDMLAHIGMRDEIRLMHARSAPGFTRECKSIAKEVDRCCTRVLVSAAASLSERPSGIQRS